MTSPRATLRLQLHKDFTFADASCLVPYVAALGISHLYVSPILTARPGSIHGYDVVDPTRVSPELGGEAGLRGLVAELRAAGVGLVVDIVPNHMAVGGGDNAWWQDVLRHGRDSRYARFFDIDWDPPDAALRGKVLAPFLGQPYGEALAAGELRLGTDAAGAPVVRYYDSAWPIDPRDHSEIAALTPEAYDPASPGGRARLHRLLERQHYRLAWWGTAGDEINWRRFFDINGLAGLRVEDPAVFEATHATLFRLYAEGLIDGLRVDHVDGLADPPLYCRSLRARLDGLATERPATAPPGPAWLVVEKILGAGETLPTDWGVDGTSGYDFMDAVNALQHDATAQDALGWFWAAVSGRPDDFAVEERQARLETLRRGFNAQLEATATALHKLARLDPVTRDISQASIRRALLVLLAYFPVYRTYNSGDDVRSPGDDAAFVHALAAAKDASSDAMKPVLDLLDCWLGGELPATPGATWRRIATRRFQQLSAPVAAKAVEDTAFYRYGRLLSRNDVGFHAARLGIRPEEFHAASLARRQLFPDAMLATATHDHKRGEDLRARLAVLSECADEWEAAVRRWMETSAPLKRSEPHPMPSPGDEAMLYQMIVGAWPTMLAASDAAGCQTFVERLAAWQEKALREAKLETDWTAPNVAYETAARDFLTAVLAPDGVILREVADFARRIGPAGAVNGLVQTLLKLTSPGVPDFFQGSEFWDLSLVDPDNRRQVDFASRIEAQRAGDAPTALAGAWRDGRVKQALIMRALELRRAMPELLARGDYRPIAVRGPRAEHVVAFARTLGNGACLTVVPRLPFRLLDSGGDTIIVPPAVWRETVLEMPEGVGSLRWFDVVSGREVGEVGRTLRVGQVLAAFPVALLGTAPRPWSGGGRDTS